MVTILGDDQLPAEIDFYLISLGFHKSDREPGHKRHAQVAIAKPKETYKAWTPSYAGEEPPF
jgi:hypothetical protein